LGKSRKQGIKKEIDFLYKSQQKCWLFLLLIFLIEAKQNICNHYQKQPPQLEFAAFFCFRQVIRYFLKDVLYKRFLLFF